MFKLADYSLRDLQEDDLDMILEWRNAEHVRAVMYTDHVISHDEHYAWFEKIRHDEAVRYFIFQRSFTPEGVVNFTSIDRSNRKCFWGFYLSTPPPPRGTARVLEYLALEYCFNNLAMRKLCCEVFSFNEAAVRLYKRFGFQQEALYRQHILKNARYEDVVGLAIFADEWNTVRPIIERDLFRSA